MKRREIAVGLCYAVAVLVLGVMVSAKPAVAQESGLRNLPGQVERDLGIRNDQERQDRYTDERQGYRGDEERGEQGYRGDEGRSSDRYDRRYEPGDRSYEDRRFGNRADESESEEERPYYGERQYRERDRDYDNDRARGRDYENDEE